MKKRNSRGFTLMELLIAISILTLVISMGYKIINSVNLSTKNQQTIRTNQSSINLVNQYLTKDIEESISISSRNVITDSSYKYTIYNKDESIDYIIENSVHKGKEVYSLIRTSDRGTVNIVENQERYNNTPFLINIKEGSGVYEVLVNYKENKNQKNYSFDVSSRINFIKNDATEPDIGEKPQIPTIPPEVSVNTKYIGFYTATPSSKTSTDKIGVWIDDYYKEGISSVKESYNISGNLRPGNYGDSEYAQIENIRTDGYRDTTNMDNIMIYVSKGTKVEGFSIDGNGDGDKKIDVISPNGNNMGNSDLTLEGYDNDGKWYSCDIDRELNFFDIEGKLSIDKSKVNSGFVLLVYGEASTELEDADIIIEYKRNMAEGMNPGQLNMTNIIKVRSSVSSYREVDENTNNTFNSTIQTLISNHSDGGYVRTRTEKGSEKTINNVYNKDLKKVKRMILTLDGNISIDNVSGMREIIPNKQYELLISGTAINFDRHINVSKLDKGNTGTLKVNLLY